MGWYVFDNSTRPKCPLCGTAYQGQLPVLNFYSSRTANEFRSDNHRLMVWDGQSLFPWHVNRRLFPNERLTAEQRKRVGYFQKHDGDWYLVNENMPTLHDADAKRDVPVGKHVRLADGAKLLLSREEGGRLIHVQLVSG
jgi:hypothetical protein